MDNTEALRNHLFVSMWTGLGCPSASKHLKPSIGKRLHAHLYSNDARDTTIQSPYL